jgi:hypothetical protein
MANVGALDQVRSFLREHPDVHNQRKWTCGTTGCIAGWAVALDAGAKYGDRLERLTYPDGPGFERAAGGLVERAATLLGLTDHEADALFIDTAQLCVAEPEKAAIDLTDGHRALLDEYGIQ